MKNIILASLLIFIACYVHSQHETFSNSHSSQRNGNVIPGSGVTDIDGNFYPTVIIGYQEWMAENLRVAKYRNGDAIPTDLSNNEWWKTKEGAYAIYPHGSIPGLNSEEEVVTAYGKLYNWYAVNDERGLCPEGWSVPSDADWTQLVDYVASQGFSNSNATNGPANALKSCRQVGSPLGGECNTTEHPRWNYDIQHHGFNEFGFSAQPGGYRIAYGSYRLLGAHGSWWSSTEWKYTLFISHVAEYRYMRRNDSNVNRTNLTLSYSDGFKTFGFSLRCLRN